VQNPGKLSIRGGGGLTHFRRHSEVSSRGVPALCGLGMRINTSSLQMGEGEHTVLVTRDTSRRKPDVREVSEASVLTGMIDADSPALSKAIRAETFKGER
jgi:hypothetical protein